MKKNKRSLIPLFAAVVLGAMLPQTSLQAQTLITDYIGFGVDKRNLYGFTSHTTRVLLANNLLTGVSGSSDGANHLATDAARNRVIYAVWGNVQALYAWDFATQTEVSLGSFSVGDSSGGAAFWNDAYYFYKDQGNSNRGLYKVTFDEDGMIAGSTLLIGDSTAALGDIVIKENGTMYILSTNGTLRSLDLNNVSAGYTTISAGAGVTALPAGDGQLFFDHEGNLLTRSGGGNGGPDWIKITISGTTYTRETIAGGSSAYYADLSSAPIPEPSTVLLLGISALAMLLRRRRF